MTKEGRCPVEGCPKDPRPGQLMCRRHWFLVPRELRDDVWRSFRRQGVLSEEYLEAREAAIGAVEQAEADSQ